MSHGRDLARTLTGMDGRSYPSYKQLTGQHDLGSVQDAVQDARRGARSGAQTGESSDSLTLHVDNVQSDPYAPPSRMRVSVPARAAGLPADLIDTRHGRIAAGDFLTRRLAAQLRGAGGDIRIDAPGQQVLERASILLADDRVEARIEVSLPAAGRRIKGHAAARLLTEALPRAVRAALLHDEFDAQTADALRAHVTLYRDQLHIQHSLRERGLVAFVADGSVLPRASGASDLPLDARAGAVAFTSPDSLRTEFQVPSGATVTGMGVPDGITVIVGGGYHGKSTLLRAMERGVYPHIGGDGREWVLTRADTASIRAEDGRAVTGVDISPFITNLPSGTDTHAFTTGNASGSTSQAANLAEAVESGATALLIDEDTSATNFMIRDARMRRLIPADREPITPFVDRIRPLLEERGVSTVLVAGGSGAFFEKADHVIALDEYVPRDVTELARQIAAGAASGTAESAAERVFPPAASRVVAPGGIRVLASADQESRGSGRGGKGHSRGPGGRGGRGPKPARGRGLESVQLGEETIDLGAVAQLVDSSQTEAIARLLDVIAQQTDGRMTLAHALDAVEQRLDAEGLDWLSPRAGAHPGRLARPRRHELLAAVGRLRGLRLQA